jgi:hypothetical protein
MARTRSAGAEATTAQASTPSLAPEPANPSAVQASAGTGAGASVPEVEHTASGVFEVSLDVTPDYPKKTKCIPICMPESSFMHIVTYK